MKMKYLPNKERGKINKTYYILAAIFLAVIFYFFQISISSTLYIATSYISAPLWMMEDYFSDRMALFLINFEQKEDLISKNEYLSKQIDSFKYSIAENRLILEENQQLKNILNREVHVGTSSLAVRKADKDETLAYVLSGPVTPPYDSLILDVGTTRGINIGDIVTGIDGFILGEIIEASTKTSKVRLFSAYGQKTSVFLGENKTMIELIGIGGGNFLIELPNDFSVGVSDLAIYPGQEFYRVALVDRIEGKDGEMFKGVFLSAPFNIRETRLVSVLGKK